MVLNLYYHLWSYQECSSWKIVNSRKSATAVSHHMFYRNREIKFNITFLLKLCSLSAFVIVSFLFSSVMRRLLRENSFDSNDTLELFIRNLKSWKRTVIQDMHNVNMFLLHFIPDFSSRPPPPPPVSYGEGVISHRCFLFWMEAKNRTWRVIGKVHP